MSDPFTSTELSPVPCTGPMRKLSSTVDVYTNYNCHKEGKSYSKSSSKKNMIEQKKGLKKVSVKPRTDLTYRVPYSRPNVSPNVGCRNSLHQTDSNQTVIELE